MRRGEAGRYGAVRRPARVLSMSFISDGALTLTPTIGVFFGVAYSPIQH